MIPLGFPPPPPHRMAFEDWWYVFSRQNNLPEWRQSSVARDAYAAGWLECQRRQGEEGKQVVGVHYEPQEFHEGQP